MPNRFNTRIQSLSHDKEIPARIIHAAAQIFSLHGYKGARVRDVVRVADVNLAAVNYYFGGKEGLYASTLAELTSSREILLPRDDRQIDPVELLREHITAMLQRSLEMGDNTKLSRILAHEAMEPTPYFERAINASIKPEFDRLIQLVRRIAQSPLSDQNARILALSIMGQCYFHLFASPAVRVLLEGKPVGPPDFLAECLTQFAVGAIRSVVPKH